MEMNMRFEKNQTYFRVRESPAPLDIPTPTPAPAWGGPVAQICLAFDLILDM